MRDERYEGWFGDLRTDYVAHLDFQMSKSNGDKTKKSPDNSAVER
jgi:hypothetical protein